MSDAPKLTHEIIKQVADQVFTHSAKEFVMASESMGRKPLEALCAVTVSKLNDLLAERRLTLKEAEDLLVLFMINQSVSGHDAVIHFAQANGMLDDEGENHDEQES